MKKLSRAGLGTRLSIAGLPGRCAEAPDQLLSQLSAEVLTYLGLSGEFIAVLIRPE